MAKKSKKRSSKGPQVTNAPKATVQPSKSYTAPKGKATSVRTEPERASKDGTRQWVIMGAVIGLIVVGVVGLSVYSSLSPDNTGETSASGWDLPVLDDDLDADGRVMLADYSNKPLVVNFFASWCTACEGELPAFRDAAEALSDDVDFVFVNSNETGSWRPMAERTGILDQVIAKDVGGTQRNGLYRSFGGSGGMPMTAYYSADGELLSVDRGAVSRTALAERLQRFYGVSVT